MKNRAPIAAFAAVVIAATAVFVSPWEGREYEPYIDPVGILTVCDGHTGGIKQRTYTDAECDALLRSDVGIAYKHVDRCITGQATQGQAVALTSATFNIGPQVVCGSTLQRKANAGDWAGACAELDRWVYAKGRKLKGLVRRRAAERALCEGRA